MSWAVGIARTLGVVGLFAIVVLSLLPGSQRPHSGLPGPAEHFISYSCTAFALSFSFRAVSSRIAIAVGLACLAATMEALQHWSPGRHAAIVDAVASSSGGVFGILAGAMIYDAVNRIANGASA